MKTIEVSYNHFRQFLGYVQFLENADEKTLNTFRNSFPEKDNRTLDELVEPWKIENMNYNEDYLPVELTTKEQIMEFLSKPVPIIKK